MSTFPHNTRRTLTTSLAGIARLSQVSVCPIRTTIHTLPFPAILQASSSSLTLAHHPSQLEPTSDRTQTLGWSLSPLTSFDISLPENETHSI